MESVYDKEITLKEELRMKYKAVKRLEEIGYDVKGNTEEISVYAGGEKIGKFIYSKEEDAPIAVIEKSKLSKSLTENLLQRTRMRVFKEILLSLGWVVSDNNKILS